jgi:hypothetical protein
MGLSHGHGTLLLGDDCTLSTPSQARERHPPMDPANAVGLVVDKRMENPRGLLAANARQERKGTAIQLVMIEAAAYGLRWNGTVERMDDWKDITMTERRKDNA